MKRIIALFSVVICIIAVFAGCKKVDRNAETTTATTTVPTYTMPEPESEYDKDSRTMKTVYRDINGEVFQIVISKYDENSNLIEFAEYDAQNNLNYMFKDYEYKKVSSGYILLQYSRYNENKECDTIYKYTYDENNNPVSMESFNPDGTLITKNEF
ncbi:MAG: hypothetical protein E7536_01745 [Ruminococcaceae bacterium]|nr:hypothetical protein [Oscillospiraceae bacterium]